MSGSFTGITQPDNLIWLRENYSGDIKMKKLLRFFKDEEGIAVIECGLIAAAIAIIIMTVLTSIGSKIYSR